MQINMKGGGGGICSGTNSVFISSQNDIVFKILLKTDFFHPMQVSGPTFRIFPRAPLNVYPCQYYDYLMLLTVVHPYMIIDKKI